MEPVARKGDVQATPSTATNYPDDAAPTATGAWAPDPGGVVEIPLSSASSDGNQLVSSASCTFLFTGTLTSSGSAFTSPPSVVTLDPAPRILRVGGSDPLVNGEEAKDLYDNKISVSSSARWRSA